MANTFKQLILSASLLTSALLMQSPLYAQSLTEAVAETINSNPEILAEVNRRISVNKTIDQARAGYLPQVDLNLGYGRENTNNPSTRPGSETQTPGEAGLKVNQMLYDGFFTKSEVDRTTSSAESAGFSVADTSETTSLRAIEVYLDVLRRQELLQRTEANLSAHEQLYSKIKRRGESGVGRRADTEQAEARLALSRSNVVADTGNLEDARTSYQRVVGNFPVNTTDPGDGCCDRAPATLDDAIKIAYHQHPRLRLALADHEAALAQEIGAEAAFHPRVDLQLSSRADNNLDGRAENNLGGLKGHEKEQQAMFRMQYNLLNGGADKARVEQTQFLSEQQKQLARVAQRQIALEVRLAWNALKTARTRIPQLQLRLEAAEKTREAYDAQFNVGQRTLLDLLDSENELLTAGTDYTNAYYDQIYACYWLAESMGQLLDALQLQPREEALVVANPDDNLDDKLADTKAR